MVRTLFKTALGLACLLLAGNTAATAQDRIEVLVGGYEYQPFVTQQTQKGVTHQLIDYLNAQQDQFQFTFVLTAPRRRFIDMNNRKFDVMFFEMAQWGWTKRRMPFAITKPLLRDYEVFFTLDTDEARPKAQNPLNHSMVGILGYHYKFAQFNNDPDYLTGTYNIQLTSTAEAVLGMVRFGRADVGMLTLSYLKLALDKDNTKSKIAISDHYDQTYILPILLAESGPLSLGEMESLLDQLHGTGKLPDFFKQIGLRDLYIYQ